MTKKEKQKEKNRKYHEANREARLAYSRAYHRAHSAEISARKKAARAKDPEKTREMNKKYHAKYKKAQNAYSREYNKSEAGKEARKRYEVKNPLYHREKQQRRRARKSETQVTTIKNIIVFERDAWCCQICGCFVDSHLCHPHPLSASLDHIIPLSKGGPHIVDNTQLAHLACNIRKQTSVVAGH